MKIIDTHQHLIYPDRFRYSWTASVPALHGKPFRLEEYRAAAARTGIAETLFMEVDVDEVNIRSEAAFFLQMADDPVNRMPGVIAACRPEHPGFAAELEAILHPKLKGLRRVLHTGPDELSQQPLFAENIARLEEHRLTFDLCLLSRQLPLGKTLLRTIPDVQFVLDHCGIPDIRGGGLDRGGSTSATSPRSPTSSARFPALSPIAIRSASPSSRSVRTSSIASNASAGIASCSAATGPCKISPPASGNG